MASASATTAPAKALYRMASSLMPPAAALVRTRLVRKRHSCQQIISSSQPRSPIAAAELVRHVLLR